MTVCRSVGVDFWSSLSYETPRKECWNWWNIWVTWSLDEYLTPWKAWVLEEKCWFSNLINAFITNSFEVVSSNFSQSSFTPMSNQHQSSQSVSIDGLVWRKVSRGLSVMSGVVTVWTPDPRRREPLWSGTWLRMWWWERAIHAYLDVIQRKWGRV